MRRGEIACICDRGSLLLVTAESQRPSDREEVNRMQIEIRRPEEVDTPVATWWIIF
jgi:hypothetical protein